MKQFFEQQLKVWPLAADNYHNLGQAKSRTIILDGFPIRLQHNPARIASTTAQISERALKNRRCFLCQENRPSEQFSIPFSGSRDFSILLNPFPIAPMHLTVSANEHVPQDDINFTDMELFVRKYPQLIAFYNGSTAGASAPDHLHFQACDKGFLNDLVSRINSDPGTLIKHTCGCDIFALPDLPMNVIHFRADTFEEEQLTWLTYIMPDSSDCTQKQGMKNIFIWIDDSGILHTLLFPRAAHRPECYFFTDDRQRLVSPGALDMAGVIILPRESDFINLSASELRHIYSEVSLDYISTSSFRQLLIK